MVLQIPSSPQKTLDIAWEALPDEYVLPDDPVDNLQQPLLAAALTDALGDNHWVQPDTLIASNFGLVASVEQRIVVKAPDWLFVPRVNPVEEGGIRRSYTPRLQGDAVAVVMEFLSETEGGEYSLRPIPPYGKLFFYEQILQVPTYVIFEPTTAALEVRHLKDGQYELVPANDQNRFWIPEMQLYLGVWHGTRLETKASWLRWWDENHNLLLWGSEQAEQERQRAEQERQRAEQERQRAEQERQRAEQERQRAEILAAKLQELGIDPESL